MLIEITGAGAVDLDLLEHRKSDVVLRLRELEDLGISARFLLTELIARETEDRKTLGFVCFVKGTQTCVLRGEASFGRDVDDQAGLTFEARKLDRLAGNGIHRDVVELGH